MEQEEKTDGNYIKGFNEGYVITQHMPELADIVAHVKNETLRLEGFRDGRKQFVLEQVRNYTPPQQKQNQQPGKDVKKDLDADYDHS